jgi:hypothetical protein
MGSLGRKEEEEKRKKNPVRQRRQFKAKKIKIKSSPLTDVKKPTSDGCNVEHVVMDNLGRTEREEKNLVCRRRQLRAGKKKKKKKTLSVEDDNLGRKKKKKGPVRRSSETSISRPGSQDFDA